MQRLALLGAAVAYGGSGAGLQGPVTGYLFDARQGLIRPIEGLPGGARLGAGLAVEERLSDCAVSSVGRRALCRTAAGGWGLLVWTGVAVRSREMEGLAGAAERVVFSEMGVRAVLHLEAAGELARRLVWVGESGVGGMVETGEGWRLLAVAADGGQVLVTNGPELWRVEEKGVWEWVARGVEIGAAVFSAGGGVYFADRGAKELWQVEGAGAGAAAVRMLREAEGVGEPVGPAVCATEAGEQVVMADGAAARLTMPRPGGTGWESVGLWGRPSQLARLDRDGLYLLNRPGEGPLLLLDCARRHVSFVPVD
ncbi:MAG: hypothetical protein NTX13_19395 [Acidobacteria bacterium]|nr:hypothetical protein [Acidobacteriota bacterium]